MILNVTAQETVDTLATQSMLVVFLLAITYGPIVEELVFRKALSQIIRNDIVFAVLSIVLFGLWHEGVSVGSIATMVTGTCFTIAYLRTGKNVVAAIVAHFTSNLGAMLLMMLFGI